MQKVNEAAQESGLKTSNSLSSSLESKQKATENTSVYEEKYEIRGGRQGGKFKKQGTARKKRNVISQHEI